MMSGWMSVLFFSEINNQLLCFGGVEEQIVVLALPLTAAPPRPYMPVVIKCCISPYFAITSGPAQT